MLAETSGGKILFTPETAAEAGRKGGQATAAKKREQKQPPTIEDLKKEGPEILQEIMRAGRGEGAWKKLDAAKRLDALKAAIPYLLGRPLPMKPTDEDQETENGFHVSVKPSS